LDPEPGPTRLSVKRATFEFCEQRSFVEISADEDQAAVARLVRLPGALQIAFDQHVDRLEDEGRFSPAMSMIPLARRVSSPRRATSSPSQRSIHCRVGSKTDAADLAVVRAIAVLVVNVIRIARRKWASGLSAGGEAQTCSSLRSRTVETQLVRVRCEAARGRDVTPVHCLFRRERLD
jgi:hypothetical protein